MINRLVGVFLICQRHFVGLHGGKCSHPFMTHPFTIVAKGQLCPKMLVETERPSGKQSSMDLSSHRDPVGWRMRKEALDEPDENS